jgi:hypothetical protein
MRWLIFASFVFRCLYTRPKQMLADSNIRISNPPNRCYAMQRAACFVFSLGIIG